MCTFCLLSSTPLQLVNAASYTHDCADKSLCADLRSNILSNANFYLRHLLLHFPARSFADLRVQNGHVFPSFEQALLDTGILSGDDEARAVMQELVSLRYFPAQLRFAFLALLEQDARPQSLYTEFERPMLRYWDRSTKVRLACTSAAATASAASRQKCTQVCCLRVFTASHGLLQETVENRFQC